MLILLVTQVTKVKAQVFLSPIMLVPREEDTVVEEADLIQDIIQLYPMILSTCPVKWEVEEVLGQMEKVVEVEVSE